MRCCKDDQRWAHFPATPPIFSALTKQGWCEQAAPPSYRAPAPCCPPWPCREDGSCGAAWCHVWGFLREFQYSLGPVCLSGEGAAHPGLGTLQDAGTGVGTLAACHCLPALLAALINDGTSQMNNAQPEKRGLFPLSSMGLALPGTEAPKGRTYIYWGTQCS